METYNNLINGKYVEPVRGRYFKNINPAEHNDIVGQFADSGKDDIEQAVQAARTAFPAWSGMPAPKRGDLIYRVADLLARDKEMLAKVIVREMGKTLPESLGDIQSGIDVAKFMASEGRRLYGQTSTSSLNQRWALTKRVPVGVCGLITAWNAPMAIITWKMFPALICGNTVVLKPSEDAPLTAHLLGQLITEAGFADGVVNIVYGAGKEAGGALVKHQLVDMISFTGSTQVGRSINEECARQLKRCSLELGGKNALIVMNDADLDAAARAVAAGAFSTAGQRCASTSRAFVHKDVYETFIDKLIVETKKMKVGPGHEADTKVCPIVNKRQFENILKAIKEGKKSGAQLVYGGNTLTDGKLANGYFIEPTIFADADPDSSLAQEEIFGPVLCVFRVNNLNEAFDGANRTQYGLTGSIFTRDVNCAMMALDKMEAGCCYINGPTFGSEPHMPFGGLKRSGTGWREPGTQAIDVFSEWKTVYIDYSGISQNSQYQVKD